MTFYEKLLKNYEAGLFTLVQGLDDKFCVFSTKNNNGNLRWSGWQPTEEKTLNYIGSETGFNESSINCFVVSENWKIIRTIHPSEPMGKGYKVGDKFKVIRTGQIEIVKSCTKGLYGMRLIVGDNVVGYHTNEIKPYFEEEEMVTIEISKKSLDSIKNYKIIK